MSKISDTVCQLEHSSNVNPFYFLEVKNNYATNYFSSMLSTSPYTNQSSADNLQSGAKYESALKAVNTVYSDDLSKVNCSFYISCIAANNIALLLDPESVWSMFLIIINGTESLASGLIFDNKFCLLKGKLLRYQTKTLEKFKKYLQFSAVITPFNQDVNSISSSAYYHKSNADTQGYEKALEVKKIIKDWDK